jgi:hypothetical protein
MPFEILTAEGADGRRWSRLIGQLPAERRDIHFLPEYGRIYRDSYGFEPLLAVYSDGDDFVLQPFVRRRLRDLPFLEGAPDAVGFTDIANPYGYGGPLSNVVEGHRLYLGFAEAFAAWCDKEDIASEFASLHPFMADHQLGLIGPVMKTSAVKKVVFIDLAQGETAIQKKLRKGHRSSIATARRARVRVEKVETTSINLALFKEIYDATMVRQNAAERWFVPADYFELCIRHLGNARSSLLFAFVGDELESGCLLMHDFSTAYYHFAGTYAKHPALGVNNLMVYEAAALCRSMDCRRFHLGGGVTDQEDDSLLRFKAGFSELRAQLYTYFSIRDEAVYNRLCERKQAYEIATTGVVSTSDFVPIYRR